MFQFFEKYIRSKIDLTDKELALIRDACIEKNLKRKQYLLREGEVCRHNCFVASGCLRMYRVADDLGEHMLRFAIENWWMSDRVSFTTGQPSQNFIDALEDSKVILWTKDNFETLTKKIPALHAYVEELLNRSFNASQERIYSSISASAEERYFSFIKSYPDFFNRIPLHMIASSLGLSSKTLTRIRRRYADSSR